MTTWKVIGNTSLPIAPYEQEWDEAKAQERIFRWAGWDKPVGSNRTRKAFFLFDKDRSNQKIAYHFPFTDVINGELVAIPKAIERIAGKLDDPNQSFGLPEGILKELRQKISLLYRKMRRSAPLGCSEHSSEVIELGIPFLVEVKDRVDLR
jgi:hypothetical protein